MKGKKAALDGLTRIDDVKDSNGNIIVQGLVSKLLELGQTACTLTDHGTLSGIPNAYSSFQKAKIKLIPGIEFYITGNRTEAKKGQINHHLIALAKNKVGWMNILKLNSIGYNTGATQSYDRVIPRIDMSVLREYTEGIIISSACLASIPSIFCRRDRYDEAKEHVLEMKNLFLDKKTGEPGYYIELQPVDYYWRLEDKSTSSDDKENILCQANDQILSNKLLAQLAEECNIPIVVTTDSHYVNKEDRDLHQLLLAVQSKASLSDKRRLTFEATPLMSGEEILEVMTETESKYNGFPKEQVAEWIQNTHLIGQSCEEPIYLEKKGFKMPTFPVQDALDYDEFLKWKEGLSEEERRKILNESR